MKPTLSIIVPLYYAEGLLTPLTAALEQLAQDFQDIAATEVIFVDDGSQDQTFEHLRSLQPQHFTYQAIRLARNFKSYVAILAGLHQAQGDYITFLPQDLQEPPELVGRLWQALQGGFDVAWAVRRSRGDRWLDRLFSHLFHRLMHAIWSEWPATGADMFMITRPVAQVLLTMQEKNSHITGQILWSGFRQTRLFYDRQPRRVGQSGWSFWKKVELAVNVIAQFSYLPLRACTVLGLILAILGFLYGLTVLIGRLTLQIRVPGWTALMIVTLLIGGFQLLFLGVIGEYLWRIFDEVRQRPVYIVMDKLEGPS